MSDSPISLLDATVVTSATTATAADPDTSQSPKVLASQDMFFTLAVYTPPKSVPGTHQPSSSTAPLPVTADPPTEYDHAVARVKGLVTFLTPSMRCTLTSLLSVVHCHLSPTAPDGPVAASTHQLITRVASTDETPDSGIKDLVDIIEKGLQAFTALGGGSVPKSSSSASGSRKRQKLDGPPLKSSHRSQKVRRECSLRDPGCQICNSVNVGEVAHIIPYSVKDTKAVDFWKFIELFHGPEATAALKVVALAPTPDCVDCLKNVWYLCRTCHSCFGTGKLAVIPDVSGFTYPYDADETTSYNAHIEFPSGTKDVVIARWKLDDDGESSFDGKLCPGQEITLTTHNALDLPLPHPLLFQLHAVISRVIALKAAAGFPLFPGFDRGTDDDRGVPAFTDDTFVEWQAQQKQSDTGPKTPGYHKTLRNRYDAGINQSHITRWFELTPMRGLEASEASESGSDVDMHGSLKSDRADDSDTDDERPRMHSVVLSEVGQRMDEKWRIARDRWMQVFEEDDSD